MDKFYEIMGEFYSSDMKKHASPTKRLIQQKNASFTHKEFLAGKMAQASQEDYRITYVTSPKKTYVVEPQGKNGKKGEIDYSLATKDPLKFYDKVMTQDIRERSVTENKLGAKLYKNVMTKRAVAKLLAAIEKKLVSLIKEQTQEQFMAENAQLHESELKEVFNEPKMEKEFKRQLTDG